MIDNYQLLEYAKEASHKAYAPYSNFKVGACALYDSGNYYKGCNVENSSYGLSLCAERNALSTAIAAGEQGKLIKLAVFSENTKMCTPCGACRQWIAEFSKGHNVEVIMESQDSHCAIYSINELLPLGFNL